MGVAVAVGAAVVGGASSVMSAKAQRKAGKAQAAAQERANQIEQRRADIANQRNRRLAAMQTTAGIAQNQAAMSAFGGFSSMEVGASSSLAGDFSSAIGASNVSLAANQARANALQQGADKALRYQNQANNWNAVSGLAGTVGSFAGSS